MRCCERCFQDEILINQLRSHEEAEGKRGSCDFCNTDDVITFDVSPESFLSDLFEPMLEVFSPISQADESNSVGHALQLPQAIKRLWSTFTIDDESVVAFLNELFREERWFEDLVNEDVVISPNRGIADIDAYKIFGDGGWDGFVHSVRNLSRFHTHVNHEDALAIVCDGAKAIIKAHEPFYRMRIWGKDKAPSCIDLYEAPVDKTSRGRMNVQGIPCLYIADSVETAAAEVRASLHDEVAVAQFYPVKNLKVVDFSLLSRQSPFTGIDCNYLAVNHDVLNSMTKELIKPVRHNDSELEYLPAQYISDYLRYSGYDGIRYASVMNPGGYNVASFRLARDGAYEVGVPYLMKVTDHFYELKPA